MGGMKESLIRLENENRRKAIQPENEEIRRTSVHSTTLTPEQAHNICSRPQSHTRNYQRHTFQTPNPPIIQIHNPITHNKRLFLLCLPNSNTKLHLKMIQMHIFMKTTDHIHKMHHKCPTKTTNTKILSMMRLMRSSIIMSFRVEMEWGTK